MDKRFWAIIGTIIVIFVGIVAIHGNKSENGGSSNTTPTNHVEGKLDSKVTLVEYGDFQCPVCENYNATVQQVQQKYNDTVKFQFRHLPLTEIHNHALVAARAAEAAGLQGKFWEMHDALYAPAKWADWTQSNNPNTLFERYAQELGLDVNRFKTDSASGEVNNKIQADVAAFRKTGEQKSTPSFFVNGKYIPNTKLVINQAPSVEAFSKVLDEALKNAQ